MQTSYAGNKLHLHWRKIAICLLLLSALFQPSRAQNNPSDNLIYYDDQWIHYGFLIGLHSSKYVTKYSDFFTTGLRDSVHSIIPGNLGGFKLGFLANVKLTQYLDFRGSITVGFYEHDLTYRFTDGTDLRALKDATMIELPMLLKYKSARRGNLAMYLLAGINPSIEAAGRGDEGDQLETLELDNWDMSIDVGVGLDIYYPFFKFSPEIRYSYGLRNMLTDDPNDFSLGLSRLTRQNLGLFITFEGGPDNRRTKKAKKQKTRKKRRLKQWQRE
ncbi:MAG: porin family protein [Bacteroidota bacterium]